MARWLRMGSVYRGRSEISLQSLTLPLVRVQRQMDNDQGYVAVKPHFPGGDEGSSMTRWVGAPPYRGGGTLEQDMQSMGHPGEKKKKARIPGDDHTAVDAFGGREQARKNWNEDNSMEQ